MSEDKAEIRHLREAAFLNAETHLIAGTVAFTTHGVLDIDNFMKSREMLILGR